MLPLLSLDKYSVCSNEMGGNKRKFILHFLQLVIRKFHWCNFQTAKLGETEFLMESTFTLIIFNPLEKLFYISKNGYADTNLNMSERFDEEFPLIKSLSTDHHADLFHDLCHTSVAVLKPHKVEIKTGRIK